MASLPEHGMFVLSDGMGGLADGLESAQAAVAEVGRRAAALVEELRCGLTRSGAPMVAALAGVIQQADRAVRQSTTIRHAPKRPPRSGCTLTVVVLLDGMVCFAHVGDSRVYRIRGGDALQLTMDHSVAAGRVRRGVMSVEQAARSPLRHRLSQAMGLSDDLQVDIGVASLQRGDRLLLCSDGLWERMRSADMAAAVMGRSPREAADRLQGDAERNGLVDNTTGIVVAPSGFEVLPDFVSTLRALALFEEFDSTGLHRLVPYFQRRQLRDGDDLWKDDTPADLLYVWASGTFQRASGTGQSIVEAAPAVLGVRSFCGGPRDSDGVRACAASWVYSLDATAFEAMTQRVPRLAAALARRMAQQLATAERASSTG